MIVRYCNIYFNNLKEKIKDYDITYLNKEETFNKNYVYIINNMPIGLISYSLIYDRIELNYIWVDMKYRQQGIASKMIEYMCQQQGIINVTLEVCVDNYNAIKLYKKLGFIIVSIRKKYYGKKDAYLMMKEMM